MANPFERLTGLQPTPSIKPAFCGPASIDCILRYYNRSAGQENLAQLMGFVESWGTPVDNLYLGPTSFGLFAIALKGATFEVIDDLIGNNGMCDLNYMDREADGGYIPDECGHYAIYCGRSNGYTPERVHLMCDYRK